MIENAETAHQAGSPWIAALRSRETWLLTMGRLLTDPVWYFYLFWFPKYLGDARHLTLAEVGRGIRSPESIDELLGGGDRTQAGPTAPAHALLTLQ